MNADGTDRRPLVMLEDYKWQTDPCVSSDGKKLAFRAFHNKPGEKATMYDLFVANADGSEAKNLGDGYWPSLSPDGKQIVFTRYEPNRGVWRINSDGTNKAVIDRQGWRGQFSPDGNWIAYSRFKPLLGANICIYDIKTHAQRFLFDYDEDTEYYREIHNVCWSPDSKRLCFQARRMDFKFEVAVISVNGQPGGFDVCFDVTDFSIMDMAWHPGGKKILVSKKNKGETAQKLFTFEPNGDRRLQPIPHQTKDWSNVTCSWTPDGKQIVVSSMRLTE